MSNIVGWDSERAKSTKSYDCCAQIVNVHWRASKCYFSIQHLDNYIWTHVGYENPEWVLDKDHITLQGATEHHVWFCVTDTSVDVYDMKRFPFVVDAQWRCAKQLVIIPHWAMTRQELR